MFLPFQITVAQPSLTDTQKRKSSHAKPSTATSQQDGPRSLAQRQRALNADYRHLQQLAERRGVGLEEALNLHRFFAECRQFEHWAKATSAGLQEPVQQEHLAALQEKFQAFLREKLENL